jgi:dTDP-4-amino-4,6-dideoxygalactose transaminase
MDTMADTVLSLPLGPHLSQEQARCVVEETSHSLQPSKAGSTAPATT